MSTYFLLFLLFIISLLESIFIPFPLTLLVLVGIAVVYEKIPFTLAFFGGVILDLLSGRILGLDSLIFLAVTFIISLYRKKIVAHTFSYLVPFSTILVLVYNYIFFQRVTLFQTIGSVSVGVILFWGIFSLHQRFQRGSKLTY